MATLPLLHQTKVQNFDQASLHMPRICVVGCQRQIGSLDSLVCLAKEPYKNRALLRGRRKDWEILLLAATPYYIPAVWHDSFICATWLFHMCSLTHSCVLFMHAYLAVPAHRHWQKSACNMWNICSIFFHVMYGICVCSYSCVLTSLSQHTNVDKFLLYTFGNAMHPGGS